MTSVPAVRVRAVIAVMQPKGRGRDDRLKRVVGVGQGRQYSDVVRGPLQLSIHSVSVWAGGVPARAGPGGSGVWVGFGTGASELRGDVGARSKCTAVRVWSARAVAAGRALASRAVFTVTSLL